MFRRDLDALGQDVPLGLQRGHLVKHQGTPSLYRRTDLDVRRGSQVRCLGAGLREDRRRLRSSRCDAGLCLGPGHPRGLHLVGQLLFSQVGPLAGPAQRRTQVVHLVSGTLQEGVHLGWVVAPHPGPELNLVQIVQEVFVHHPSLQPEGAPLRAPPVRCISRRGSHAAPRGRRRPRSGKGPGPWHPCAPAGGVAATVPASDP